MKMAFEIGLFHGDPHPGNIRVLSDGSICLLDYGMIGVLEDDKREFLVDLFLAITHRNLNRAVDLIQIIGQPFRPIDTPLLRADVRDFIENYYGVPLERLKVGRMLSDFVAVLLNHGIRCPADLMLLVRCLVTLEGVGRDLDPSFNLAAELAPFMERVVSERYNPRRMIDRLTDETRMLAGLARDIPRYVGRSLEKLSKDELKVQFEHTGLDRLITELDRSSNRVVIGVVMSSLIISSSLGAPRRLRTPLVQHPHLCALEPFRHLADLRRLPQRPAVGEHSEMIQSARFRTLLLSFLGYFGAKKREERRPQKTLETGRAVPRAFDRRLSAIGTESQEPWALTAVKRFSSGAES